jgi:hypothetical protein
MITTMRAGRSMRAIGTMKTMETITTGDTGNTDMHQFRRPDRKIRPLWGFLHFKGEVDEI